MSTSSSGGGTRPAPWSPLAGRLNSSMGWVHHAGQGMDVALVRRIKESKKRASDCALVAIVIPLQTSFGSQPTQEMVNVVWLGRPSRRAMNRANSTTIGALVGHVAVHHASRGQRRAHWSTSSCSKSSSSAGVRS